MMNYLPNFLDASSQMKHSPLMTLQPFKDPSESLVMMEIDMDYFMTASKYFLVGEQPDPIEQALQVKQSRD